MHKYEFSKIHCIHSDAEHLNILCRIYWMQFSNILLERQKSTTWVFDISAQKFGNKRSAFEWLITALNLGQNNSETGQKLSQDCFFQLNAAKFGLKRTSTITQEHQFKRKASTTVQHLLQHPFYQHPSKREFKTQKNKYINI